MQKISLFFTMIALSANLAATDGNPGKPTGTDPTKPADAMADLLKARIAGAEGMKLLALAVGGDEGVALVGENAAKATAVRRGSVIEKTVEGIRVEVAIRKVSPLGVELEVSGDGKDVFLPGSFTPLAAPTNAPAEFLRYLESDAVPVGRLVRLIADQTGVNISATEEAGEKPVSIFLRNVTATAAVEEICRTTGLWFRREPASNVIRITTMEEYAKNLNTFREEATETFTLLYPNVTEVAGVIYGLYPDRTLLSLGEEDLQRDDEYDLSRRFRRLRVIEENGDSSFMEMQSPRASTGTGSGGGQFSFSRGSGLSHLSQWDQLQRRGRERAKNLKLSADEAKTIDENAAEKGEDAQNPVEKANIFVSVSRRNNKLIVRTSDMRVMDEIRRLVKEMDVPTPMVLMEVKVLELDVTDDFAAGFNWGLSEIATTAEGASSTYDSDSGTWSSSVYRNQSRINGVTVGDGGHTATFSATDGSTGSSVSRTFGNLGNLGVNLTQGAATVSDPTFAFSILSDRIAASLELMQKDGKIRTLATPTLLTANNEASRIFSGYEYPIVTGWSKSETIATETTVVTSEATAEVEIKNVGTMLLITPNINADKTVTLRLLQENSAVGANKAEIPVDGASGSKREVEYIESRSLTGTFVAKDGEIILAGGLIKESLEDTYWRTPFLGSLPLVGWLFRGVEKAKRRTELVVMIRPYVILTPMEGGKISEELLKKISGHPARDGRHNLDVFIDGSDDPTKKERSIKDDLENLTR